MSHELVRTRGGTLAVRCLEAGEVMHPGVGPVARRNSCTSSSPAWPTG